MITSNLAPNNQLLPYALRPLTLAFKYEEESEERMGVSRAAILTLAHCQQTETVSDDQANESRWLEGKSNREATWPMRTAHRQRPRSGSFHPYPGRRKSRPGPFARALAGYRIILAVSQSLCEDGNPTRGKMKTSPQQQKYSLRPPSAQTATGQLTP